MNFNINETVKVKITPFGHKILKEYHDNLMQKIPNTSTLERKYQEPPVDEDGYIAMQLWSVMQKFGPHIHLGMNEQPISTTIIIGDKQ